MIKMDGNGNYGLILIILDMNWYSLQIKKIMKLFV